MGLVPPIAYMLTIAGLNFGSWLYIKYRFNMQPFTYRHLLVIVIAAISYFAGAYFWRMPNVLADIAVRSTVTTIIYGALTYYFNISADVNEKVESIL